jgi:hypothetical protein
MRKVAEKVRHAGDDWILAEPIGVGEDAESVKQSKLALEKLHGLLEANKGNLRERLMVARLRGKEEDIEPPPLSNASGPPPSTPPQEFRRDAQGRPELPAENSAYLGRALFTDYLLPVELGGLLLLVATVGAIAIAQRRESRP